MKLLIFISVLLSASLGWACPELSGSYKCLDSNTSRSFTVAVTQSVNEGVTMYTSRRVNTIADGVVRGTQTDLIVDTSVASCKNNNELEVIFDFKNNAQNYAHRVSSTTTTQSNDTFKMLVIVEESDNGNDTVEERTIECQRTES